MKVKDLLFGRRNEERVAIQYRGINTSYRQLHLLAEKKAAILRELSDKSNFAGIFLPNSLDFAVAYFALSYLDRIIVPISVHAKQPELFSTIKYCGIRIILTNKEYGQLLFKELSNSDASVMIVDIETNSVQMAGRNELTSFPTTCCQSHLNDVAVLLHTSGSTSNPKRVMLTHDNLLVNIRSNVESLQLTQKDRVLIALPMIFGYCHTAQFLTHLYLGAVIVIMDSFFLPGLWYKTIQKEKITNFTAVPSMLYMIAAWARNRIVNYDLTSLRYICFGGGVMPAGRIAELMDIFPSAGMVHTYGQTEAGPRISALLPVDARRKLGSIGKAIPGVEVQIVSDFEGEAGIREIGELIVRGTNIMKGYFGASEETAKVLKNGWLYTGDLGFKDEEGFLYLVGRKKNIIISLGMNIYPEEIEEILLDHPAVKEACVEGYPSELMGEGIAAKIVIYKEANSVSESEIIRYCMERLSSFKVPHRITLVSDLPKTLTGKIRRNSNDRDAEFNPCLERM
ncbi:class I adenylate-forming enzyme family protein [Paenibacillus humicus]|uniref:class I adenylate-forming enzyme family protein n=1 Tax=Paenibacillus humicus TaxID=412861 RepID=UPI000FD8331A|nr:class I adenylate-forming enzyme family protein [Paenibacillus humicus]